MKIEKSKEELINFLINDINLIKDDQKKVETIKEGLKEYKILTGKTQELISKVDEEMLDNIDMRVLILLTEQVYKITKEENLKVENYFNEKEIKTAKQYDYQYENTEEQIELPLTMENVLQIDTQNYLTFWDAKFANKLLSDLLIYNPETQRESKIIKRNNQVEFAIKLYPKSVKEMTAKLLQGKLHYTTITINALVGTAESGNELTYNHRKQELTVNEGTALNILDGMHRLTAIKNALEQNPDLKHVVQVAVKNFNLSQAKEYLAEVSKQNAVSKTRIKELEKGRFADITVDYLKRESDLRDRISSTSDVHYIANQIVSYDVISDTVDDEFNIASRFQADEVGKKLSNFFYYLFGQFPDEFINSVSTVKKQSFINANKMFAGYIVLAKRMDQENIPFEKVKTIIDNIDFSRSNPLWREIGFIGKDSTTNMNTAKNIRKYFNELDLKLLLGEKSNV